MVPQTRLLSLQVLLLMKCPMEARMTLCNMAIEAGGTCGICYPDATTVNYLWDFIKDEFETKEMHLKEYSKWISDEGAEYEKYMNTMFQI